MTGPRRLEIGTVPEGVFESRMTCAMSGGSERATASAQKSSRELGAVRTLSDRVR
jgi:hypothetical protein